MYQFITPVTIAFLAGLWAVLLIGLIRRPKEKASSLADRLTPLEGLAGLDLVEEIEEKEPRNFIERKELELKQSGTGITLPVYFTILALSMLTLFVLVNQIIGNPIFSLVFSLLGFYVPEAYVRNKRNKNMAMFHDQYLKCLRRMSASLRAGSSIRQALQDVVAAETIDKIVRAEFRTVLKDIEFGDTIERALFKLYDRIGSKDVHFTAVSVEVNRSTGGNLAEIFDDISKTISDRKQMEHDVKARLAQTKATSTLLSILPVVMVFVLMYLNPGHFSVLTRSTVGQMIVFFCLGMIVTGYYIINKATDIKL